MSRCDACLDSDVCATCLGLGIRDVGGPEWATCADCGGTGVCMRCRSELRAVRPTGTD